MNTANGRWHLTSSAGNHTVEVCRNDVLQVEGLTHYLTEGLHNGEAVVVFAKPALRKAVISEMMARNLDVHAIKSQGQIRFFDAEFLLSSMLVDDVVLEEQAFEEYVGAQIEVSRSNFGKVRVYGGMVAVLWNNEKYDTAMQLENFWVNLTKKLEFSLLCSYSLGHHEPSTYEEALQFICTCHKHLAPLEKYDFSNKDENEELVDILGIAWNRILEKLAVSSKNSSQFPQHQ